MFVLYKLSDFEISYNSQPSLSHCLDIRIGHIKDPRHIPKTTSGLAENEWYINRCGEHQLFRNIMYELEFAIKELFVNEIYKTILGYAPDTLIAYDESRQHLYRVSRKIQDAELWSTARSMPNAYSFVSPIYQYRVEECGSLVDKHGSKSRLFGLATISVLSFLLGDGDVHPGQYLLQHTPTPKVWKIDNQAAFCADYPITVDNLLNLPHYKSLGYLNKFDMDHDLPKQITSSTYFRYEKKRAVQKLLANMENILKMLEAYCDLSNYDVAHFSGILTPPEQLEFPNMLSTVKEKFLAKLDRISSTALYEFINTVEGKDHPQNTHSHKYRPY